MPITNEEFVKIIKAQKLLKSTDLEKYNREADKENVSLFNYLLTNNIVEAAEINEAIADSYKMKCAKLETEKPFNDSFQYIPEIVAQKESTVVFKKDHKGYHIATSNPKNSIFIKNLEKRLDHPVTLYYADEDSVSEYINSLPLQSSDKELNAMIESASKASDKVSQVEDLPIINIVEKILILGYENKASDIHIEAHELKTDVRFRIDGIMHDIVEIPKNLHDLIVTRIKIMARLRTDEHRAAQDGRLRFKSGDKRIDVRVSIVPVIYGEKVVMRLLSEKARQYDLENLGLNKKNLKIVQSNIDKPWGMILVTGPTGTGKTTTLYSILKILNTREVNISTIEDPVEYDIEGINQIQVNANTNLSFAAGLRAIVRQDPDIIMVGEIRDEETARIAINSAMTGHLVLSTLHTNDAPTTLPRLMDMGVEPFLVASTINIAIAQRLVRKVCNSCRKEIKLTKETIDLIQQQLSPEIIKKYKLDKAGTKIFAGEGCPKCQNTGYTGRIGIFEILTLNDEIKRMIMEKANAEEVKNKAIAQGMTTMIEDGVEKVLAGVTTIEEVLRVTRE